MAFPMDSLLVCVVLIDLALLAISRLVTLVRIAALQGVLIGALALYVGGTDAASILTSAASLVLKGIVFPFMLMRAMRETSINREVEPYIGLNLSIIIGLALLALSLWLGSKLPLPVPVASTLIVPVALFTILAGLFLIVGRLKALTQIVGYLVLENGIYTFSLAISHQSPWIVELGILLDVFVAVFIMGVITYQINREFDHIDTNQLTDLKD
jgi:hydrogenase-4 component E